MSAAPDAPAAWTTPAEALHLWFHGHTVRTAGPVALLVGTLLSVVNQGTVIASGQATGATWARTAVNYVVPFTVASYGWLSARRHPAPAGWTDTDEPIG